MRDALIRAVWAAACVVLAAGLAPLSGAAQMRRDAVVIGMAQEPDILGPFSTMAAAGTIHNSLFAFFAPFNEKWQRVPLLVEKLPTLKDGDWELLPNKKMRVTWKIRRGFTWHDGRPVTALDARFSYGMLRNPRTPTLTRFILNKVDNILVPNPADPYTMVVQWNERWPFANAIPYGFEYPLPRHVLERQYLQDPGRLRGDPFFRAPVANGPYRFKEWVPGSHITLEAYDRWPGERPKIKTITFRFILDAVVLAANQMAGSVDATEINNFGIDQMVEIERRNPNVAAHYTEALIWERIEFNNDDEWLKDKRVRWAIAHAIDRETIVRTLFQGKQPVAHAWLPPRHPGSNPNVKKYAYDPARARALLAEAGFTMGPDGILRDPRGRRFEMTFMTTAGNAPREQTQQIIKEQLKAVGIEIRIDNRPASVFFGTIVPRRQFPHLAEWATLYTPEVMPFTEFHSSQIPSAANNWEGSNRRGWRHAEVDRLAEQIGQELDEAKRVEMMRRLQDIFVEELPGLPMYFRLHLTTSVKALKNVKPTGLGSFYINWNSHEWSY
ncbi:MAG: peptide ABC transporter substrate-binding protein [Armatimonadota bacterium]|nr:peptide ABC transporter substrate-binding protein [Armatimonadota bacterium]